VKTESTDPALLVGLETPDDAAVYQLTPDVALVQTVDFFTPVVDDPFTWGRIAAANALSDVYAMGGAPKTALNLVGWPRSLDFEILGRVLEGGEKVCNEAGVAIVGGHSVDDPEPKYGLSVTGVVHPDRIVRKTGGAPGDVLVLTKPLGSGIISSAIKERRAERPSVDAAVATMTRLNRDAAEAMVTHGARAATDVTGFGLVGHLLQMLAGSLDAELELSHIPVLPGAPELAAAGIVPGGSVRNRTAAAEHVTSKGEDIRLPLIFDAQTSGGLLIAVSPDSAGALLEELHRRGDVEAARIGTLTEGSGKVQVRD
jgi:selenide,water dikinase